MKKAIELLLKELHRENLLDFKSGKLFKVPDYAKVLVVGGAGTGKTYFINNNLMNMKYAEHHSLMEVVDLSKYNYIILFQNRVLIDNNLCREFGNLHELDRQDFIVLENTKFFL